MPEIVVTRGPGAGNRFPLDLEKWKTEELLLGRSKECHILLHDTKVSKQHSRFYTRDGRWFIEDLGSRNGIYVNGERLPCVALTTGDEIRIGDVFLLYVDEGDTTASRGAATTAATEVSSRATVAFSPTEQRPTDSETVGASRAPRESQVAPTPRAAARRSEPAVRFPPPRADKEELKEIVASVSEARVRIRRELARVIVGQEEVIEDILTGLLARGHALLEGVPGLAKTLLVSTLAQVLDLHFTRIQFTPDLMPADITGTEVLEEDANTRERRYRFIKGPIFANMLLADEINRTPPKTQAALLEAMQEFRVTAAGTTYSLTPPFYVLATQNPIEQEGTYPLPEAQLDRFMLKIVVGYPSRAEEVEILRATTIDHDDEPEVVLGAGDILRIQKLVRRLPVSDYILYYAADLARATRPGEPESPDFIKRYVSWGAGPRAAQYLTLGAKAQALLQGRANVTLGDVRRVAHQVLRHRLGLNFQAASEGLTSDRLVARLLKELAEPKVPECSGP